MEVALTKFVAQLEFNTRVFHGAHVAPRFRLTQVGGHSHLFEHTVGTLLVVIYTQGQGICKETEVDAHVGLLTLLPLDVGVWSARRFGAVHNLLRVASAKHIVVAQCHIGCVEEVADVLVTILTPREANLGIVEPLGTIGHKGLVGNVPTCGN